jgi:hypothetical protein
LAHHARELAAAGFHIALDGDEWRHELTDDNYRLWKEDSIDPNKEYPFLKLSAKCSLDKWNESPEILFGLYQVLIRALEG